MSVCGSHVNSLHNKRDALDAIEVRILEYLRGRSRVGCYQLQDHLMCLFHLTMLRQLGLKERVVNRNLQVANALQPGVSILSAARFEVGLMV